jgi:hypothetical protein
VTAFTQTHNGEARVRARAQRSDAGLRTQTHACEPNVGLGNGDQEVAGT